MQYLVTHHSLRRCPRTEATAFAEALQLELFDLKVGPWISSPSSPKEVALNQTDIGDIVVSRDFFFPMRR